MLEILNKIKYLPASFQIKYPHEEGFQKYFQEHIAPILNEAETKRISLVRTIEGRFIACLGAVAFCILANSLLQVESINNVCSEVTKYIAALFDGYSKWYASKHWSLRIILPSKLIYWDSITIWSIAWLYIIYNLIISAVKVKIYNNNLKHKLWHSMCAFVGPCEFEHDQQKVFVILKGVNIPNVKLLNVNILDETTLLTTNGINKTSIAEFNIFIPKYSKINPSSYSEQILFRGMLSYIKSDGEVEQGTILYLPNNQVPSEDFAKLKNVKGLFHKGNKLLLNDSLISAVLDLKSISDNSIIQVSINNNICSIIVELDKHILSYTNIFDRVDEKDVRKLLAILQLSKVVSDTYTNVGREI
jgi:hypothetical protein